MIRSLTIGLPIGLLSQEKIEAVSRKLLQTAGNLLGDPEYTPRTIRYTLMPIGKEGEIEGHIMSMARYVDDLAKSTNVRWFCLPFDFITEGSRSERLSVALDIITRFPKTFLNFIVADGNHLSLPAINDVAALITKIAKKSNNGFDNFRVGASCGCPPNSPFFPFSYHKGDVPAFSFALETTKIAIEVANVFESTIDLDIYRDKLIDRLSSVLSDIHQLGKQIEDESGCEYRGLDASFAPFPDGNMSVGILIEQLLGVPVGSHGTVFITAFLTDAIRASIIKSGALETGFNGVMYSLLEDNGLASANSRRLLNLDTLVALSSVCACGVDMVPVPGNSFPEEIAVVIADIASMSLSLKKPLGIRMLPIPGRSNNEFTQFNCDFLCDSRIVGLSATDRFLESSENTFGLRAPSRLLSMRTN
jgi:uncharacterized protein (UPF0210 family)